MSGARRRVHVTPILRSWFRCGKGSFSKPESWVEMYPVSLLRIYRNCTCVPVEDFPRPSRITFCVDWLYRVVRSADINIGQRSYGRTEFARTTSHLTFSDQISTLFQSCYYQIRELRCHSSLPWLQNCQYHRHFYRSFQTWLLQLTVLPQSQIKRLQNSCS